MSVDDALLEEVRIELIGDREELEEVVVETAAKQAALEQTVAEKNEKTSAVETAYELTIESLERQIAANVKRLQVWALGNRKEEFGERQSITVGGHKLCFRKSPGKFATADGVKEPEVVDNVRALADKDRRRQLLSIKVALDKKAVLKLWEAGGEGQALLRSLGIEVEYPETFRFEPDLDEVPREALKGV